MTDAPTPSRRVPRVRLNPQERRESILAAAVEVFAETGYRAGTVSKVAQRVGVSEPVIFQNFGSKAALFAAVLDRVTSTIKAEFTGMADRLGSVSDLLAEVLSPHHLERLHAPGSLGALFADAAALTSEPGVADAARRAVQGVADLLSDLLRRGQAQGNIRSDLDPESGAWWVLSMMATRPFRAAIIPGRPDLEAGLAVLTLQAISP
ncbi:TetR/AcrR family transcriptional regulator [Actinomadura sp. HBU206391]|uniref:TetR/AcrR family transcriptional regulator n=1 Tax=Actinomadura sp. HBU206391 TaxID=2731692 RepID=UPI00165040D3|nr:TetR/AcrR family transcriptional regulator [Actinomadura sp. HBU206391]MBC6459664.1 TetR/AcrR family transcriptional regulator [Actinomadura sp. HBU206391]